jgi:hypothetical protein
MLARRLLLFVAILMGITALTAGLARPPEGRDAIPTPEPGAAPPRPITAVDRTLDATGEGEAQTVAVNQGDLVTLTVTDDVLDVVELRGLDLTQPVSAQTPAVFSLLADRAGDFPVVLIDAGQTIGTLRVTATQE